MKLSSRSILVVLSLLAGGLPAVHAADFPNKPIRWIIPFPPGGSNDVLGRFLFVTRHLSLITRHESRITHHA